MKLDCDLWTTNSNPGLEFTSGLMETYSKIGKLQLLLPFNLFNFSKMEDIIIYMKEIRTTGLIPFHTP